MSSGEATGTYELGYIVLSHIHFIVSRFILKRKNLNILLEAEMNSLKRNTSSFIVKLTNQHISNSLNLKY